jgi:hypothetical protein
MRRSTLSIALGLSTLLAVPALGQAADRLGVEATIGLAHRGENNLLLATDGIQASVRATLPVHHFLRMVGAATWTRLPDLDRASPSYCPAITCRPPDHYPGLGMAGLGAGVQSVIPVGPVQLRVTGLGGGQWIYHRPDHVPALAASAEAGLGLALPIGTQIHLLLQGRVLHPFGAAGAAANSRQLGAGIAIN